MISQIKKRDGRIVDFDSNKICQVIWKAAQSVGGENKEKAEFLAAEVTKLLEEKCDNQTPTVEDIQDSVEKVLIEQGHAKTAKSFILYRQKRKDLREAKKMLGIEDDTKLSLNSLKVLEGRYLRKDKNGKLIETPKELFCRVANNISQADFKYNQNAKKSEQEFLKLMLDQDFMPNSPTLMNAGTEMQQLSACFVLPIEDSIEGIFESVKNAAIIHQSGGGTGFAFSRLRPKGDPVGTAGGVASGPISFMKVFNAATEQIKQGGKRRGANMGVLRVDHPDILDFITCKEKDNSINNFNISVGITDEFMNAIKENRDYDLINPQNKEIQSKLDAKRVFDLICTMAWKNGDPGIVFLDSINKKHALPEEVESTNPCGEVPLLPYESCNLGSINLANHTLNNQVDWEKLKYTIHTAVHFMDNVIDLSKFPVLKISKMVLANRKMGLGVMGLADMLIKLKLPYDSEPALQLAEKIMEFVNVEAKKASVELAKTRGTFPNFEKSIYNDGRPENRVRNATRTSIAPTGTISIIGGCSSGIEPLFAISYLRKTPQFELLEINPLFEEVARQEGFYTEDLMKKIAKRGSIQDVEEVPEQIRKVFVTAMDLTPEAHVKMQAAFQKHTDNAVSKTVNFPFTASVEEVAKTYLLAYELGCKGTTIYRDGSRDLQVLNVTRETKIKSHQPKSSAPSNTSDKKMFTVGAEYAGGCTTCDV
ncbi:adenosylcobalamin-dependent ribonucleoside-diphosphate reductase [Candidatus Woesearchaeota archaeon]|nr:adenosylcobalamin-dependent ribonucleoside-diphosphate reductase [Candidatus Woesearchaeota archaeon]